ncbi:hypothetical protein PENANT_c007G09139 [Penicillium antarcticum]|uniref:Condensation domain-containing protein n=1 Tax=Penicillium antarcticum TaxID=416450 RepID=A0A1V6QBH1_9EURO|nr:hypothetical protein PENANT_c007G09139 [Penicillium antarcticum]
MSESTEFIRTASKNERRYIMRHALGFYNALTLTGLYTIPHTDSLNANNLDKFIPALKHCIAVHPFLSTAIKGENTENPSFVRPASINLRNHLHLVDMLSNSTSSSLTDKDDRDLHLITQVTKKIHDEPFVNVDQQPPWKVLIVPLSDEAASGQRVYIIFACSHSHGDGKSGLEFHKTFLEGLKYAHELYDQGYLYQTSTSALPLLPPLEEAANLSITWRYLFLNLFGRHMPSIACRLLGLQPPANIIHGFNAWTGRAMTFDPSKFHTGSEALLVKKDLLTSFYSIEIQVETLVLAPFSDKLSLTFEP